MKKIIEFFTNNGCFMAHYCGAITHSLTMACFLYYSWLINALGGSILAFILSAVTTYFFCWVKEKTDKTGFSKSDLQAGVWGIVTAMILFIVIVNIHNGV